VSTPGTQLRTYAALSGPYSLSVATIAIVMRILHERGAIVGVPDRDAFVPENPAAGPSRNLRPDR
jgi:hypothetical protein